MSTVHWIQTIIEILIAIVILVGFFYEPALVRWEQKQSEKILKAFKERRKYWR